MSDDFKILLVAGGLFAAWYAFLRPVPVPAPSATVPPPANPYGSLAGYAPQPNYPSNPGDPNNYIPGVITSLAGLGTSIANAVTAGQRSGSAYQSSGSYSQVNDYSDTGYGSSAGAGAFAGAEEGIA